MMRLPNSLLILALSLAAAPYQGADSFIPELDAVSETSGTPAFEPAPAPSKRLKTSVPKDLGAKLQNHFAHVPGHRLHVQLDRPLYKPGDDLWFKTWAVQPKDFSGSVGNITVQLVDPSGAVRASKTTTIASHGAANDFVLPDDAPGGRWMLKAHHGPTIEEHAFVVSAYQAPQINKELTFLREAYGAGQTVEALVELKHGIQGVLAHKQVRAMLTVDGVSVLDETLTTDASGAVFVQAVLPGTLTRGDGLLTVLVEHGGVSESISRSVPIVLSTLDLAFYPEGGDLVDGLLSRVYFEAKNTNGDPADIEGFVLDDQGSRVAELRSVHDGLGRFSFTPRKGRSYQVQITAPVGIEAPIDLPQAGSSGCTLRAYDDFSSTHEAVRVGVRCTEAQDVYVVGAQRETLLDAAAVHVGSEEAIVYLKGEAPVRQGAVRVTVFDTQENPVAERLVYRGAGRDLQIEVQTDREVYGPRDKVRLKLSALDASGEPVQADLALAVVDDAVVSLADDEEGHILSRLYLNPELVEAPDDPAWYFDADEPGAREGLDLVMGTKGWRRFDWQPVLHPVVKELLDEDSFLRRVRFPMMSRQVPMAPPPMAVGAAEVPVAAFEEADVLVLDDPMAMPGGMPMEMDLGLVGVAGPGHADGLQAKRARPRQEKVLMQQARVPARSFPVPDYRAGFQGVRSDFRDTVFWAPSVVTDKHGKATIEFYLSDAITSFRVTSEGVGGGLVGHEETTFRSVLPVSVAAKIPSVVSAGDRIVLPLTVTSTRSNTLDVSVAMTFDGPLVSAKKPKGSVSLAANGSGTVWIPLKVGSGQDSVGLEVVAQSGGMTDTLQRTIEVVQPGFPRSWSAAGELADVQTLQFELEAHQVGSLHASVMLHPGPTSSLVEGLEGLIRTPGGCFEQTSSTNWPNVAILNYLEQHEGNDRLRAKSAQALEVGYGRLSGFQVDAGGFETFGSGPGKEVLSAFGLLQFTDMAKLYPVRKSMLQEDATFLLSRRDGEGGYKNSGDSAHGYGSAPKPVSDGFITYALVAAGHEQVLKDEIAAQAKVATRAKDPYVLALAARTLLMSKHPAAKSAAKRLAALQGKDGRFPGAESSITRSYEANLDVEATALATMALMDAGVGYRRGYDKGIEWLTGARNGGTWGATQATAMALQALTQHAALSEAPRSPGDFSVVVNGRDVGRVHYQADQTDSIEIPGLEEHLRVGKNTIELHLDAANSLPFALEANWTSVTPISDPGAELHVETVLTRSRVKMGETVRLTTTLSNRTDRIVPSPIARVGIPAGLEAPIWQLKELQERGVIAFYETRPREVTLYWEGIHPDEQHTVNLDLEALVPGAYTAPATSAYPYYNDDEKGWARGVVVEIDRP